MKTMHEEALTKEGKDLLPLLEKIGKGFWLAGGTALALQMGHRVSVDFDFFSNNEEIEKDLFKKAKDVFKKHKVEVLVDNKDELTFLIGEVKVTFLRYPFQLSGEDVLYKGIKLLTAKEIVVTKAYTIGRRGEYKDYVDMFFALEKGMMSLGEVIDSAKKKYGDEFNIKLFLEQLVWFDDVENVQLVFLRKEVKKEEVKRFFKREVQKLGESYLG